MKSVELLESNQDMFKNGVKMIVLLSTITITDLLYYYKGMWNVRYMHSCIDSMSNKDNSHNSLDGERRTEEWCREEGQACGESGVGEVKLNK